MGDWRVNQWEEERRGAGACPSASAAVAGGARDGDDMTYKDGPQDAVLSLAWRSHADTSMRVEEERQVTATHQRRPSRQVSAWMDVSPPRAGGPLPNAMAGCSLADMANIVDVERV